jgi:hypothetical protein
MQVNRRLLEWGIFLMLLGGIPALVQLGLLDPQLLVGAWRLWPLIVVGFGLGLILRRTSLAPLGGMVVAATFGVILGSLLAAGPAFAALGRDCGGTGGGTPFPDQTGAFSGERASVELHPMCRAATIATAEGNNWAISGTNRNGQAPRVTATPNKLTVRGDDGGGIPFLGTGPGRGDWRISLPRGLPVDLSTSADFGDLQADLAGARIGNLSLTVNFGQADVNLAQATVQSVSVTANFGSTVLHLPASSSFQGSATANFGSLDLCVPEAAGLRITVGGGAFSSTDFTRRGMTRGGNTWTSAGYDAAAAKIDLSTTANFGSIQLDEEDCQ